MIQKDLSIGSFFCFILTLLTQSVLLSTIYFVVLQPYITTMHEPDKTNFAGFFTLVSILRSLFTEFKNQRIDVVKPECGLR